MISEHHIEAMVADIALRHPPVNLSDIPNRWRVQYHRRARRMILRYQRGMGVLTLPPRIQQGDVKKFLHQSLPWLIKEVQAEKNDKNPIVIASGAEINILGERKEIIFMEGRSRVKMSDKKLLVYGTMGRHKEVLKKYLWRLAKEQFPRVVNHYCQILSVKTPSVVIRDPKSRWGSCIRNYSIGNEGARIMLSFRLILAPPLVLAYLAAHESCHLKESNHSKRFWQWVEKIFPDYKLAEQWLSDNGKYLMCIFNDNI